MPRRASVKPDQIGYWSEIKLEIISKYATAYSRIMVNKGLKHAYIDGFSGRGIHISRKTGRAILGSPLQALQVTPPFRKYFFVDIDGAKTDNLRELVGERDDVQVLEGDCNRVLLESVFPKVRWDGYWRGLCLLDPYGLHLNWEVMLAAARAKSIEIFLNFPIMDMNRNALWHQQENVTPANRDRMTAIWGDESWKTVAYRPESTLFGTIFEKQGNPTIASAFQSRLRDVAGFKYVPEPMPMRNAQGAVVYYLYFASHNQTGGKIVSEIFRKYRDVKS